jgi:hypothetical protein
MSPLTPDVPADLKKMDEYRESQYTSPHCLLIHQLRALGVRHRCIPLNSPS